MAFCARVCGRRLLAARHRDGPLVVVDHEDDRQPPDTGQVHRLVDVAPRGRTVAEDADRGPGFAAQLEGERNAHGVGCMGADRDADREVLARPGKVAAALVAAPVEQELDHGDAAQQLRRVLPEGRQQDVFGRHGGRDPDPDCLLAEAGGVSPKAAGALQGNRLLVEGPGPHHRAVQPLHDLGFLCEGRQLVLNLALWVDQARKGNRHGIEAVAVPFDVQGITPCDGRTCTRILGRRLAR